MLRWIKNSRGAAVALTVFAVVGMLALSPAQAQIAGDLDGNGIIDDADFQLWLPTGVDANGDGLVDGQDFDLTFGLQPPPTGDPNDPNQPPTGDPNDPNQPPHPVIRMIRISRHPVIRTIRISRRPVIRMIRMIRISRLTTSSSGISTGTASWMMRTSLSGPSSPRRRIWTATATSTKTISTSFSRFRIRGMINRDSSFLV